VLVLTVHQMVGDAFEMGEQLGAFERAGTALGDSGGHVGQPGVPFRHTDAELEVAGHQARMATQLVVKARAAPKLSQEKAKVVLRQREVLGVKRPQHVVAGHTFVKVCRQRFEKLHTAEALVHVACWHLRALSLLCGPPRRPPWHFTAYARGGSRGAWPEEYDPAVRLHAVAVVLVLGSVLGSCGGHGGPSRAGEQKFLNSVYSQAPDISGYRDSSQLVALGQAICQDLESGASVLEVGDRLPLIEGSVALPPADLGAVISASVAVFCPKFHNLLGGG